MKQYLDSSAHFSTFVSLIFPDDKEENFAPKKARGGRKVLRPIKIFWSFFLVLSGEDPPPYPPSPSLPPSLSLSLSFSLSLPLYPRVLNMPIVKVRTIRLGGKEKMSRSAPWIAFKTSLFMKRSAALV